MELQAACAMCENYMVDVECDNDNCPVLKLVEENVTLKKKITSLKKKIEQLESAADYARDIRFGQVQGMW